MRFRLVENALLEGTRYDEQAAKIIADSGLFGLETSKKIIDALFREDIHAFNHAPNWLEKYLKGIARMLVEESNGDIDRAQSFLEESIQIFDQYLTWVKENREKVGSSIDVEFITKMSYQDVKDSLDKIRRERYEQSKKELADMKFGQSNYSLTPINSFSEFHRLFGGRATGDGSSDKYAGGGGTAWCHANSESVYNSWVRGGNKFFVLQRDKWKDIPFNTETNKKLAGKDDYGNSLIALLVSKDGRLKNATLRCNHIGVNTNADNQYTTFAELSKVAGFNVEEEIKNYIGEVEEVDYTKCFVVKYGVLTWNDDYADYYGVNKDDIIEYTIPDSVTSIGDFAFQNCSGLTSITIPSSVTSIGNYAFDGCSSLTAMTIPDSVTYIGDGAFYVCSELTSITIPEGVTSIPDYAFYGCSGLKLVTIGNGIKSIGYYAFRGCSGLVSVTIPDSVTSTGESAFENCSGLKLVTIGDGVTSISDFAFYGCSGLSSITIPYSVTSIGSSAFEYCDSLTNINYSGTKSQWNQISKMNYWNSNTGNYTIHCTDGNIKEVENESFKNNPTTLRFRLVEDLNTAYITLYHNTPYSNVNSILKNGLKIGSSRSELPSGWQMTWATTKPMLRGEYGGNIIEFRLPKDYDYEKVNDTQYIIYSDIEPNLIDSLDYMVGNGATGYMHTSELKDYIDKYGKGLVKKVLTKEHNEDIPFEKIKELTKELDW